MYFLYAEGLFKPKVSVDAWKEYIDFNCNITMIIESTPASKSNRFWTNPKTSTLIIGVNTASSFNEQSDPIRTPKRVIVVLTEDEEGDEPDLGDGPDPECREKTEHGEQGQAGGDHPEQGEPRLTANPVVHHTTTMRKETTKIS